MESEEKIRIRLSKDLKELDYIKGQIMINANGLKAFIKLIADKEKDKIQNFG